MALDAPTRLCRMSPSPKTALPPPYRKRCRDSVRDLEWFCDALKCSKYDYTSRLTFCSIISPTPPERRSILFLDKTPLTGSITYNIHTHTHTHYLGGERVFFASWTCVWAKRTSVTQLTLANAFASHLVEFVILSLLSALFKVCMCVHVRLVWWL